jgi:hypothetical protein
MAIPSPKAFSSASARCLQCHKQEQHVLKAIAIEIGARQGVHDMQHVVIFGDLRLVIAHEFDLEFMAVLSDAFPPTRDWHLPIATEVVNRLLAALRNTEVRRQEVV